MPDRGPRLEALLDEHLCIQISLREEGGEPDSEVLEKMRQRLLQIDDDIIKHWDN